MNLKGLPMYMDYYKSLELFGQYIEENLKELFQPRSKIVIPFTESMIKDLCSSRNLSYEEILSDFRSYFKTQAFRNQYCNLASCVFQVMVAYNCIATGTAAYNETFSILLGISISDLQKIYSECKYPDYSTPKQEQLWIRTKDFLEKKCNLLLCIPKQTTHSGRYVQFPRKQQLFSMREYNKYDSRFKKLGISHEETYTYKQFSERVFNVYESVCTNKFLNDLDKRHFEKTAREVIFYCFCNWIERETRKRETSGRIVKNKNPQRFFIQLDVEKRYFTIRGENNQDINENKVETLLRKPFVYDEVFGDWIQSNTVTKEDAFGICIPKREVDAYWFFLQFGSEFSSKQCQTIRFFVFSSKAWNKIPLNWKKPLKSGNFFVGGIKDEEGSWIPGLLPFVARDKESDKNYFYLDSKKKEFDSDFFDLNSCNLTSGLHFVKLPDRSAAFLRISSHRPVVETERGWSWGNNSASFCSTSENWLISGLNIGEEILAQKEEKERELWGNYKMGKIANRFKTLNNETTEKNWRE